MTAPPSIDARRNAKHLYWMGWRVTDIADTLRLKRPTVEAWRQRDKWDGALCVERMEGATEARYVALVSKTAKTGADYKEIDLLGRQIERFARVRRYSEPGGHEGDLNPNIGARNQPDRKKPVRNHFTDEQVERLRANFEALRFGYQEDWWLARHERTRTVLKSRQIGATYYFAFEALIIALETGNNQIFLSASKSQAHVFKNYIIGFANEVGVKLSGDPIVLSNGAELHFLGTNARTAQGYHGDFYFDEFFWVFGFEALKKVASGMAAQKKYRRTYFSTPSSIHHEAFPFWTGTAFNKGRAKADQIEIDVGHAALRAGRRCEDGAWRQIVNIHDAEAAGCDLFDVEELKRENAPEDFANLYLCEFIDDTLSVFPLSLMQGCLVDSWIEWKDFEPARPGRPFGDGEVWLGYDPQESETGDNSALVVVARPRVEGGPFRLLERHQFRGMDFTDQAAAIRAVRDRFNVTHIGIDKSGVGAAVFQLVRHWFPAVAGIQYNVEVKTRMVLHAKSIIARRRLQFDAGWHDVTQSFMAIRKVMTGSGEQVTYKATRAKGTGHADVAWAVMHALDREPLGGAEATRQSIMEIY